MKTLILTVILLTAPVLSQELRIVEDEFRGDKMVFLEKNTVDRGFMINAGTSSDKIFVFVDYVSIRASRREYRNSWLFLDELLLMVDGELIEFKSLTTDRNTVRGGGVTERAWFIAELSDIEKIAGAEEVRYRIRGSRGRNEGEFSQENIEGFRKFYQHLTER